MQADQGPRVVVAQHARGAEERFADLFGMRQRLQLLFELRLLTLLESRSCQFLNLETEIVLVLVISLSGIL